MPIADKKDKLNIAMILNNMLCIFFTNNETLIQPIKKPKEDTKKIFSNSNQTFICCEFMTSFWFIS